MLKLHLNSAITALLLGYAQARNLAITSDGIAIATAANGGRDLITYDAVRSVEQTHRFSNLPNNIDGFDDVAVDPQALARDSTVAFAIDAESGIVCSCE